MRRFLVVFAILGLVAVGDRAASAQAKLDVKAELDAIKKQLADLTQAAASSATVAQSVQDLGGKVAALEQDLAQLKTQQTATPDAVAALDRLGQRSDALERQVQALVTQVAGLEQPAVAAGGGMSHDGGYKLATGAGDYSLTIGGYVQPRFELAVPQSFDTVDTSTFRLRRARLFLTGQLGSDKLTYRVLAELSALGAGDAPGGDLYLDYKFAPELIVRGGQAKVPFLRSWMAGSPTLDFVERTQGIENIRYDRDIGVWAHGLLAGDRLGYWAGLSNGAGKNRVNDNIDMVSVVRFDVVALGQRFELGNGDVKGTDEPALMVGGGATHDLVAVPARIAGIDVGNQDVDNDGVTDNIRVLSTSLDGVFRYRGLEVAAEGYYRQERWGTILQHSDNSALADAVKPSADGHRNYLGGYLQASYFVLPHQLEIGARVSHSRLSLLELTGRELKAAPIADRVFELDLLGELYENGARTLGAMYTFSNFNARSGPEPSGDKEHRLIVEYQLKL